MSTPRLNDPEDVRLEYACEERLVIRQSVWSRAEGPDPRELLFRTIATLAPRRVLEVGGGQGELAARMRGELHADVTGIDSSPRMVDLQGERGIDARVGDVQELPFPDGSFDCVVAAWMLYHVPNVSRGLSELARVLKPGGSLVAVTNSERHLVELWTALGDGPLKTHPFSAENGAELLRERFVAIERADVVSTLVFDDREVAWKYVANSVIRAHLADRLPHDGWPLRATCHVAVFVARRV